MTTLQKLIFFAIVNSQRLQSDSITLSYLALTSMKIFDY